MKMKFLTLAAAMAFVMTVSSCGGKKAADAEAQTTECCTKAENKECCEKDSVKCANDSTVCCEGEKKECPEKE